METDIPSLRWRQDGVDHVLKLLPGGRIGFLSDEMLAEAEVAGDRPDEKIAAIRAGDCLLYTSPSPRD